MNFTKAAVVIGMLLGLTAGAAAWRASVHAAGFRAGQQALKDAIDKRDKEIARLNKKVVAKDQDVLVAKQEDRERIVTIYRTIRESAEPEIVEKPVYRDCRVGPGVLRNFIAAAEGGVPADPSNPADDSVGKAAGTGR
ncbi:hypothetical protein [Cupriavidus necator]|uniref:hypothetical protein n=1 Tax=Cupriavidus necator TaxID=106590 RepID=UPI00278B4716|nr:hypothetical protein [Cupriavidus necator]MDQ0140082.1 hypothetical protein [Cupriavidus necator]